MITFIFIYFSNPYLSKVGLSLVFITLVLLTFYVFLLLDKDKISISYRKKIKKYIPDNLYKNEFRIRKTIITFLKKVFYKDLL